MPPTIGTIGTQTLADGSTWTPTVLTAPNRQVTRDIPVDEPVRTRQVFYCMGYDPQGPSFYHAFFRHQFDIACHRHGLVGSMSPRRDDPDGICSNWEIQLSDIDWEVDSDYIFFRWDDLVKKDLQRPLLPTLGRKLLCDWDAIVSGTIFRLIRLNWRFGLASTYPSLAILALMVLTTVIGGAASVGLNMLGLPGWAAFPATPALAVGLFVLAYRLLSKKCFLHLLVADGIFSMQHARGECHEYLQRIDEFADRLVAAVNSSTHDEIVVVGHSSGSFCAVEVLARALRKDPHLASRGPRLSLVTLGANLPLIGCHPQATSFRNDVTLLAEQPDVYWLEYQSALDLLSFPSFDPGQALTESTLQDRQMNPTVHAAHIRKSMEPPNYVRNRLNFWRLHFQYMMAVDRLVPCDYMMIVAGPASLEYRGSEPESAMQLCYADGHWLLEADDFRPSMPLPLGRQSHSLKNSVNTTPEAALRLTECYCLIAQDAILT